MTNSERARPGADSDPRTDGQPGVIATSADCYGHGADDHSKSPAGHPSDGWRVLSYLMGGILVYGAIGWGLDRLFDTSWMLPVGIVVGAVLSVVQIYFRYTHPQPDERSAGARGA